MGKTKNKSQNRGVFLAAQIHHAIHHKPPRIHHKFTTIHHAKTRSFLPTPLKKPSKKAKKSPGKRRNFFLTKI
jgi:hypothetical protein